MNSGFCLFSCDFVHFCFGVYVTKELFKRMCCHLHKLHSLLC